MFIACEPYRISGPDDFVEHWGTWGCDRRQVLMILLNRKVDDKDSDDCDSDDGDDGW